MTTSQESSLPPTTASLFSEEQWRHIQSLLDKLDEHQSLWLSGFLAARGSNAPAEKKAEPLSASRIWIAYGSETGNCESLARDLGAKLVEQQIGHQIVSLADLKPRALSRVDYLLIICSTHGDGDPPEPTAAFFDGLMSDQAPRLADTAFAVLALGDSSYEHFCTAGRNLDERLEQLGARRLVARRDCDVDFEQPAQQWMDRVLQSLPASGPQPVAAPAAGVSASWASSAPTIPTPTKPTPTRQSPLLAEVLENICLSHSARAKPVHHLELLIEPGKLQLSPGDAVGILPHNPPNLVAALLDAAGFSGDEPVTLNKRAMPLVEALREHLDLNIPSTAFLATWADASDSAELRQKSELESKEQRQFLRTVQILDLLRAHPGNMDAQAFVDCLRPLQPRLYDVANAITADTDELHLTVKDFRYAMNKQELAGIASHYLLQAEPGECISLYPHHNKRFHLPSDKDAPLILVANGTGIAPFRAFLQALAQEEGNRNCWLIFQEAHAEEDFLYQLDIQQAAARGVLHHLDTLFTADRPGHRLDHVLNQRADRLLVWLGRGAHLYICGEKNVLGTCEDTIKALCEQGGSGDVWAQSVKAKRVHRNLY